MAENTELVTGGVENRSRKPRERLRCGSLATGAPRTRDQVRGVRARRRRAAETPEVRLLRMQQVPSRLVRGPIGSGRALRRERPGPARPGPDGRTAFGRDFREMHDAFTFFILSIRLPYQLHGINNKPIWLFTRGALDSAKNHKRQRRKRQSVTA